MVTAESTKCELLYTEDLNDGQIIRGVKGENPFLSYLEPTSPRSLGPILGIVKLLRELEAIKSGRQRKITEAIRKLKREA